MNKKKDKTRKNKQEQDIYISIVAIFLITFTVIGYQKYGPIGIFLTSIISYLFGVSYSLVYCYIIVLALYLLFFRGKSLRVKKYIIAGSVFYLTYLLYAAIPLHDELVGFNVLQNYLNQSVAIFSGTVSAQGGIIGAFLYSLSSLLVAKNGTYVIIVTMVILGLLMLVDFTKVKKLFGKTYDKLSDTTINFKSEKNNYDLIDPVVKESKKHKAIFIQADEPKTEPTVIPANPEVIKTTSAATSHINPNYSLPPITILDNLTNKKSSNINMRAADQKSKRLIEILSEFGINAELISNNIGPSVTKIEIKPDSNVKISKIAAIQDNLKMELAAKSIRIEAPIPGRNAVGVEIPNVEMTPVRMYELISAIPDEIKAKKLLFILGKDLMGKPVYCELDKMPHLLIAGATGSGKSVCVNGLICTILLRTTPDEVKLLLIDPKKVEFTQYHDIPHLIGPVISDSNDASRALKVIVDYMENRYEVFSKVGVRNIVSYNDYINKHPEEKLSTMPRIVVVIDELADLMSTVGKDVEQSIQRITQLARAAGIHLIVATQRPSTDVITGIIKANIPSRIAFAVSSGIDSRTIIDTVGAERLLGNGDMLYWPIGEPSSIRLQGVYVTDDEVNRIAEFTSKQMKPMYDDAFIRLDELDKNQDPFMTDSNNDPLYDEVVTYISEVQKASTSLLQRKFGIGYNRAARLIDVLEQRGMIGPAQGSKPRDVFIEKPEL